MASKGIHLKISPARKMVLELLRHSKSVPTVPVSKVMELGRDFPLIRKASGVTWMPVWLKAYGILASRHQELRTVYTPYPWTRFYLHPENNAVVLVEREVDKEMAILASRLKCPEQMPLSAIDEKLKHLREDPVESIPHFKKILLLGKLPTIIRRLVFHFSLYWSGAAKARRFGTFMISSQGYLGCEQEHPIHFCPSYLTFGPIEESGKVTGRIIYDHRVMDGRFVAKLFSELEEVLQTTILPELQKLAESRFSRRVA